ncbi:hypothetical protein J3R83DRAFT_13783 [Lanmaoa asiatica]|nr:hypothetical protein J3R83DRAFT_13783 [Lanmaoa asiatica]
MAVAPSTASSSGWELASPACPRRSLLSVAMPRSPQKKRSTCAALDAAGIGCLLPPGDGVLWCHRHNEERLKLYMNYKAHHTLLKAYPDIPACRDVVTIMACDSLSLLREWNAHLRCKYNLLTRCIEARVYFTRRFFGCDFGHKIFWDGLVRKRSEVEQLMLHVETRGYQLILKCQNALWVLEQDTHEAGDCSGYGDLARGADTSFHSTESVEGAAIEDPLEAVLREKAIEFREKVRMCLAWYCAASTSRFYDERLEVIYAYVRRAIYKDASLMFLSQSYDSVMALLSDRDLDLITMEKIWHGISALCVHDVQSAVDDVLRSTDGDHVVVLGGKVFKDVSGDRWPLHAWGHMVAIRQCYSCLRTTCRTIDEVIDLTRYALLTRAPLSQTYLKYDFSFDGSRELVLAGFIPNDIPLSSPRHSISCKETGSHSAGPVWEETKRNISLYAGLSLSDPMAQPFVNACIRHPDLMVMLRKGADARIIRSSAVVWTSRRRRARSPSALASVSWEKTKDVVRLSDLALEDAQPSGWAHEKIANCMQVIIVDASEGTMGDFVRKLVGIWCQVYNVSDKEELYNALKGPYEAAGELEEYLEVTGKIALDYYQSLWGCMPPPVLVGDPEGFLF